MVDLIQRKWDENIKFDKMILFAQVSLYQNGGMSSLE